MLQSCPPSAALFSGPHAACRFCAWPALPPGLVVVCPLCAEGTGFFAAFSCAAHGKLFLFLPVFRCFVPGLRAAFLPPLRRHFCACLSGLRCLPAVRFVRAVPSCFGCLFACSVLVARAFFSYLLSFAFSCLAFAAQTSFHLSLRPRRGFPCLSPPVALFPVCRPSAGFVPGLCCCLLLLSFACVAGACLPFAQLFSLIFSPFSA